MDTRGGIEENTPIQVMKLEETWEVKRVAEGQVKAHKLSKQALRRASAHTYGVLSPSINPANFIHEWLHLDRNGTLYTYMSLSVLCGITSERLLRLFVSTVSDSFAHIEKERKW